MMEKQVSPSEDTMLGAGGPLIRIKEERDTFDTPIAEITIKSEIEDTIEFDEIKIECFDSSDSHLDSKDEVFNGQKKDFIKAVNQDAESLLQKTWSSLIEVSNESVGSETEENSSLMCKKCFLIFQTEEDLINHKDAHSNAIFQCPDCNEVFDKLLSLKCHRNMHRNDEKLFKCDICNKSISCKRNLKEHMLMHFGELPYQCDHCKNFYRSKRSLAKHIRYHTFPRKYKCPVCKKPFLQPASLKSHLGVHKSKNVKILKAVKNVKSVKTLKEYQCNICDKKFTLRASYRKHVKSHEGVRYPCEVCQKMFKHKSSVAFHMQSIHQGLRPFKCEECGKEFNRPRYLRRHMSSHNVLQMPRILKVFDGKIEDE